ncbi:3-deoxy-7-phosphoheptulonate synthase [Lentisphaera profundi]|uniref:Phospho-2-dehydro-3-deoxyheptonate aldolase n=1 Tax=Lentisphaera profundi TaxID=1658616 RepID=A0ABY7VT66_9BACT|nr:3-deoxy-7-phosphoheptulonate synthase [Lentisphaera profundi]WDE97247.1 3-deoxy-7-phosphoheptulonate synthase [Lentisphaera profundi]
MSDLNNIHIAKITPLSAPAVIRETVPVTDEAAKAIQNGRDTIVKILNGEDKRLMVITGPCSIHSKEIALDYATRLTELQKELNDKIFIVMRVYFEKPRTIGGWKGLINDPHINNSYAIEEGVVLGREILREIATLGLATATEFLDPIVPQYLSDLVSWAAIGARTTESQTHREMASGLSMPVGFKNSTDGSFEVALNAIQSSRLPQHFLGIDANGRSSVVSTTGNPHGHLVLRGGHDGPNYDAASIAQCVDAIKDRGIDAAIVVDCSHANSSKDHNKQIPVLKDIIAQINETPGKIKGVMLESNIGEGNQSIPPNLRDLKYGVSITDKCLDWDRTAELLRTAAAELA